MNELATRYHNHLLIFTGGSQTSTGVAIPHSFIKARDRQMGRSGPTVLIGPGQIFPGKVADIYHNTFGEWENQYLAYRVAVRFSIQQNWLYSQT